MNCFSTIFFILLIISPIYGQESLMTYDNSLKLLGIQKERPTTAIKKTIDYDHIDIIQLNHLSALALKNQLTPLFTDALFSTSPNDQELIIHTTEKNMAKVLAVIESLDYKQDQVHFDVQIIEVSNEVSKQITGLLFNSTGGFQINYNFETQQINNITALTAIINGLIDNGEANIIAQPQISSLENTAARIHVGDQIPYVTQTIANGATSEQVNYINTGIELDVRGRVSSSNHIVAQINAKVSSIKFYKQFNDNEYPIISSRETSTEIRLKNNDALIIAGLLDESKRIRKSKIPILGYIPLLGRLFRSSSNIITKTDILFMITPRII